MADESTDQAPPTPAQPAAEPAPAPVDPPPASEAPPAPVHPPETAAPPSASSPEPDAPPETPTAQTAPAPTSENMPAAPGQEGPEAQVPPAPAGQDGAAARGDKPKRRRSRGGGGGGKVAKAWGVKSANVDGVPAIDLTPGAQGGTPPGADQHRSGPDKRAQRKKPSRPPRPREKGPLPFDELREAARTIVEIHGKRAALRDAFGGLARKEREQLSEIVAADGDFRVRARAISAGSLSAGKIGKALAAQQIAIAEVQDLWALTLSKEDAAERQSWVRNAKRRDEDRAKRQQERANKDNRISKEDMAKARDGHVNARVRIDPAILAAFGGGDTPAPPQEPQERDRKQDKKPKKPQTSSVLDRLGY